MGDTNAYKTKVIFEKHSGLWMCIKRYESYLWSRDSEILYYYMNNSICRQRFPQQRLQAAACRISIVSAWTWRKLKALLNLKVAGHTVLFPGAGTCSDCRLRIFVWGWDNKGWKDVFSKNIKSSVRASPNKSQVLWIKLYFQKCVELIW